MSFDVARLCICHILREPACIVPRPLRRRFQGRTKSRLKTFGIAAHPFSTVTCKLAQKACLTFSSKQQQSHRLRQ